MRLGPQDDTELLDELETAEATRFDPFDDGDDNDEPDLDDIAPLTERAETFARRMNGQPYKPALRQLSTRQQHQIANAAPSWWTLPNADFAREAARMAMNPKAPKVPGSNNVIGWKAAF